MKKLLLLEWKKLWKPILISHLLSIALMVILTMTLYKSYALEYDIEAWELANEYFAFIFPLLVVLPTCWLFYYERKNHFIMYTVPRVSKRNYLFSKWIIIAGNGFLLMFSTMIVGVIVALYLKPDIIPLFSMTNPNSGESISQVRLTHFLPELFTEQPFLYGFLLSIWRGLLGSIMATMGFVLSLFSRNIFIILSGPFIYYVLENYVLSILQVPQFRLVTSFEPSTISFGDLSPFSVIVGPALAILFIFGLYYYFTKIKKQTIYPS